ncbi:hypothetical protein GCM10028791_02060 [Echinicola sediminis]
MSMDCNHIVKILKRDGTDRTSLHIPQLDPNSLQLQGFKLSDWIIFALNFSTHLNFYKKENPKDPNGDWSSFFSFFTDDKNILQKDPDKKVIDNLKATIDTYLNQAASTRDLTPHLTLFISFLKLLEHGQDRFNGLTKRHLDFYYREILHLEKAPLVPDHVYLVFELAKNISQSKLDAGTALDGGKDSQGSKRSYLTIEEALVNQTKVAELKNVFNEIKLPKSSISNLESDSKSGIMVASPIANSADGLGADFPKESRQWWPFGHTKPCSGSTELLPLPNAHIGFSLASSMLLLAGGRRTVTLKFTFTDTILNADRTTLNKALSLAITLEKEWMTLGFAQFEEATEISGNILTLAFTLAEDSPAVIAYDPVIHGGQYDTHLPLIKVSFLTQNKEGYNLYRLLNENILRELSIKTTVTEIKKPIIENELGNLNPEKPFFPFTPRPSKGASFRIHYPEAIHKPLTAMSFRMDWLNTPIDFKSHYSAYLTSAGDEIVDGPEYFKAQLMPGASEGNLFEESSEGGYYAEFNIEFGSPVWADGEEKKLKLSISNSFLHELYAQYFTLAAIKSNNSTTIEELPKEPYTPFAENINLSYTAKETIDFSSNVSATDLKLYHEEPFGHYESYPNSTDKKELCLIPAFCHGGELYIGLEKALPLQQISLLFQFLEGSENPNELNIFKGKQQITWAVLANNAWHDLDADDIVLNQSPTFLKTGLFRFVLPKQATTDHTRLPTGYHWLRAKMKKPYDVVCQLLDVQAQAVEAVFEDNGNNGDQLDKGLEAGTISKLQQRLSTVKSIKQPFPSFGGKEQENDDAYYRRISERLRHKQRAISLWDYEHLILQQFPKVHKVKCLNHTREKAFQSPGNVTLILVPDTVQQKVFDIYQPRVSQATLNEVSTFINGLNSFHVDASVINPHYEEVRVVLKVKFKKGLDENFYLIQIQEDIKRFLSPWAYDQTTTVSFGVSLHKSQLIHYLEQLNYVDYLEDIQFKRRAENSTDPCNPEFEEVKNKEVINPTDPKSILVSAKNHKIDLVEKNCSNSNNEPEEACQH